MPARNDVFGVYKRNQAVILVAIVVAVIVRFTLSLLTEAESARYVLTPVMSCTHIVELKERAYPIRIGAGELDALGPCCAERQLSGKALLVVDERVAPLYADRALAALRAAGVEVTRHDVPAGEAKSTRLKSVV